MSSKYAGIALILSSATLGSLFPIIGKLAGTGVDPIFFAGGSVMISTIPALALLSRRRRDSWHKVKRNWRLVALNSLFNIIIPYILFYIGIQLTSGVHAALLLLTEIPFTVLFTPLFGEPTTRLKVVGSGLVAIGAAAIVWSGSFNLNTGDILIIASTAFYPFGNFFAKKAMNHLSSEFMVVGRSLFGGVVLLLLSGLMERGQFASLGENGWWLMVINGLAVFGIGKIFWFEGFRTMDISKAIALLKIEPMISLLLVAIVLAEPVTWLQLAGALVMVGGVYTTLRRASVPLEQTRYST